MLPSRSDIQSKQSTPHLSPPPFPPCHLTSPPYRCRLATSPLSPPFPPCHLTSLPYLCRLATSPLSRSFPPCHLISLLTFPTLPLHLSPHLSHLGTSPSSHLSHFATSLPSHLSNLHSH